MTRKWVPWSDVARLVAMVPGGEDRDAITRELQEIRNDIGVASNRSQLLTDGRKAAREIAALRKALDGLGDYVRNRLEEALRPAFLAVYDPNGEYAAEQVRTSHDVFPGGRPIPPPLGCHIFNAFRYAVDLVEADVKPDRGPKGYGPGIRHAAPALVDLYCRYTGTKKPYYDARAEAVRNPEPLHFTRECLVAWCGERRSPAAIDIVWLLS